jgi:hypothetical protein
MAGNIRKRRETWRPKRELAAHHIRPYLGTERLRDLTAKDIRVLLNDLTDGGRRDGKGDLAPQTVRHVYAHLMNADDAVAVPALSGVLGS